MKLYVLMGESTHSHEHIHDCVEKLEKLWEVWRNLQKSDHRSSLSEILKRKTFVTELDDLFDISHNDAM